MNCGVRPPRSYEAPKLVEVYRAESLEGLRAFQLRAVRAWFERLDLRASRGKDVAG